MSSFSSTTLVLSGRLDLSQHRSWCIIHIAIIRYTISVGYDDTAHGTIAIVSPPPVWYTITHYTCSLRGYTRYLLFFHEADVLSYDDTAQGTHELVRHVELFELVGKEIETLHLHKVAPHRLTSLEVRVQNLHAHSSW